MLSKQRLLKSFRVERSTREKADRNVSELAEFFKQMSIPGFIWLFLIFKYALKYFFFKITKIREVNFLKRNNILFVNCPKLCSTESQKFEKWEIWLWRSEFCSQTLLGRRSKLIKREFSEQWKWLSTVKSVLSDELKILNKISNYGLICRQEKLK